MKTYRRGYEMGRAEVREAYLRWLASNSGRKNGWRVRAEYGSEDALLDEIHDELKARSLSFRPIERRVRREGAKDRLIGVESVKQQVCDYLAVAAIEPLLRVKVGFWQVGGVPGKGQTFAKSAVQRWSREGGYVVHADVRQCYKSIRTDLVRGILHRYVGSEEALYLCGALLDTYDGGLELGSYLSLRLSQLVLSFAYHEVEDMHKERRGRRKRLVAHQLWYADDVYLFSADKRDLRMAVRALDAYLRDWLGLELKPWKVCPLGGDEPVDAAGYTVRPGRVTVRARTFLRALRAFRRFDQRGGVRLARRVCSYWGLFRNSDSSRIVRERGLGRIAAAARRAVSADEKGRLRCTRHTSALSLPA